MLVHVYFSVERKLRLVYLISPHVEGFELEEFVESGVHLAQDIVDLRIGQVHLQGKKRYINPCLHTGDSQIKEMAKIMVETRVSFFLKHGNAWLQPRKIYILLYLFFLPQ